MYLQKMTWLGFIAGLAVALVAVVVLKFSAGSRNVEEVYIVNPARVNVNYPAPDGEGDPFASEGEPAPFTVADPDEGVDEAGQVALEPSA